MHEQQHKAFLDLLEKNEDDLTTRQIYADWLEEWGYCEEAERQRLWPESKRWLVEFCEQCKQDIHAQWREWYPTDEEYAERLGYNEDEPLGYQELIEIANDAYREAKKENGELSDFISMWFGGDETMMEYVRAERETFWKHWSIITGNPLPDDGSVGFYFRCAC